MRRSFGATLFIMGCATLLSRGVCLGQITFIPGPPTSVPNGPQYAASGDFDGDGLADIAVSSVSARKVTVGFGSPDGTLRVAQLQLVGRGLRGLATADLNNDRNADIAVTDFAVNRVFEIAGNGDGTFVPASGNFIVDRRGPVDVAAGNLDGKNGPDMVTANSAANTITTLLNLGRNQGFSTLPNVPIGQGPHKVRMADFNSDGVDDLAVLNTRAAGVDNVAVALNPGTGNFQQAIPVNYVVGKQAKALTIGDYNADGIPDLAVLNAGAIGTTPTTFSITILLNTTLPTAEGGVRGTGLFSYGPPLSLSCPVRINLIPITCFPQDIKNGDFNRDGFNDLAVSVSTRSAETNSVTAGFVSAFSGRGEGAFDFATQVLIGLGPREMVVGDFTGDAVVDIAVTEVNDNDVRILRSEAPPPSANGQPCNSPTQCLSTYCVDGVCCGSASCPDGQDCDITGHEGVCTTPLPDGQPCEGDADCASGFCVDGACCNVGSCPNGQFCNTGECGPPGPNGIPCTEDAQCASGNCVDGRCCATAGCPLGQTCNIPGSEGTCTSPNPNGKPCTEPEQCLSGFCVDLVCCNVASCPVNQTCNAPGSEGQCSVQPTPTRTPTRTQVPTQTPTPQPTGAVCGDGSQCVSGFCVDGVCCSTSECPEGQRCNVTGSVGVCAPVKDQGEECSKDSDCESGNCTGTPPTCGPARTATPTRPPTPTRTPTQSSGGGPCGNDAQCVPPLVCNDEDVCCETATCPAGQSCNVVGHLGVCFDLPTPTPTRFPIGAPCDVDSPELCETDSCVDGVCCEDLECLEPDRCDIFGFEGFCWPPLGEGEECDKNTDCEEPLICSFNALTGRFECSVPPTPLPTLIPFTPAPTAPGPQVSTSRGGGCAIDGSGNGSGWVLAAAAVLWAIRPRPRPAAVRLRAGTRRQ